jgi:hypothetical protein
MMEVMKPIINSQNNMAAKPAKNGMIWQTNHTTNPTNI